MSVTHVLGDFAPLLGRLAFVVGVGTACGAPEGDPDGTGAAATIEVRGDTTIVRTPDFERRFLDLVEEVSIGVLDGDEHYMFGSIGSAAERPDGSVLVFDEQYAELRLYDRNGVFLRTVGRQGEGPGEFAWIQGLRALADGGFATFDGGLARLTRWDAEGTLRWSRNLPLNVSGGSTNRLLPATGETLTLVTRIRTGNSLEEVLNAAEGYILVPDEVAPLDTVAGPDLPDPAFTEAVSAPGVGGTTFRTPMVEAPVYRGYGVGGMLVSPGAPYLIELWQPDGSVLRIEVGADPVPIQTEEREWFRDAATRRMQRFDEGWSWSGPPVPEAKPFVQSLRADDDGWIFARVHQPAERVERPQLPLPPGVTGGGSRLPAQYHGPTVAWEEPEVWDLFEPSGRYHGSVTIPGNMDVVIRGHDVMWAVVRDELEVETLRRYRVQGPVE